jgi:hypothetical protein
MLRIVSAGYGGWGHLHQRDQVHKFLRLAVADVYCTSVHAKRLYDCRKFYTNSHSPHALGHRGASPGHRILNSFFHFWAVSKLQRTSASQLKKPNSLGYDFHRTVQSEIS